MRDSRAGGIDHGHGGSRATPPVTAATAEADWRLPLMVPREMISAVGPSVMVQDRLTVRISAFDRLSDKVGTVGASGNSNSSNPVEPGAVRQTAQTHVAVQEGAMIAGNAPQHWMPRHKRRRQGSWC